MKENRRLAGAPPVYPDVASVATIRAQEVLAMKRTTSVPDSVATPLQPANAGPPEIDYALLDLLREWREEDATDDPEVIRQRGIELEEFKRNMNETRRRDGRPPVYP